MKNLFISLVLASMALVGCAKPENKDNPAPQMPPLTDTQKATFFDTLDGIGRVEQSVSRHAPHQNPTFNFRGMQANLVQAFHELKAVSPLDDAGNQIDNKIGSSDCAIEANVPTMPQDPNQDYDVTISLKSSGANCPVITNYNTSLSKHGYHIYGSNDLAFYLMDADLVKANNVAAFSMKGPFDFNITQNSNSANITFSMNINGNVKTQNYGSVVVSLTGTGNGVMTQQASDVRLSTALAFVYPGFTALLEAITTAHNNDQETTYWFNKVQISQADFDAITARMGSAATLADISKKQ